MCRTEHTKPKAYSPRKPKTEMHIQPLALPKANPGNILEIYDRLLQHLR